MKWKEKDNKGGMIDILIIVIITILVALAMERILH
jgi:hypothetical protein